MIIDWFFFLLHIYVYIHACTMHILHYSKMEVSPPVDTDVQ